FAFPAEKARGLVALSLPALPLRPRLSLYGGELRDVGPRPAGPGLVNSIAAAFGTDDMDPFYVAGGSLGLTLLPVAGGLAGEIEVERQSSAYLVVADAPLADRPFRPVAPAEEGTRAAAVLRL